MKRIWRIGYSFLLAILLCTFLCLPVSAKSLIGQLNSAKDNSSSYSDDNSNSVTDEMRSFHNRTTPDKDSMSKGVGYINGTLGYAISVMIIILFASVTAVTVVDLAFIGIPFLRTYLFRRSGQNGSKEFCLISTELKVLVLTGNVSVSNYFKRRALYLVLLVICVLFLTSSIVMNFGVDVGNFILYAFGF